jgi:hypothetical protein
MNARAHHAPAHHSRAPIAERTADRRAEPRKYADMQITRDVRGEGPGRGVSVAAVVWMRGREG